MLGKVLKYDLRSTKKDFSIIYAAIIGGSVLLSILIINFNYFASSGVFGKILGGLIVMASLVLGIGSGILSIISIVNLYQKKVFGSEGYLTNCLPIKTYTVTLSKLIATTIWTSLALIVSIIGILIIIVSSLSLSGLWDQVVNGYRAFHTAMTYTNSSYGLLTFILILCFISLIIEILDIVMTIYLIITVAEIFSSKSKKGIVIVLAVLAIIGIQTVLSICIFGTASPYINDYFANISTPNQGLGGFSIVLGTTIVIHLVFIVAMFFINNYLLKYKLELE